MRTLMSALGHKPTFRSFRPMSALPPKADITESDRHVRFVPIADIGCFLAPIFRLIPGQAPR